MNSSGFITLHRKILDWEWYKNTNTFALFIHLLLTANYTDGKFEGKVIHRGQLVTSLTSLSEQTTLSIRQVRVALDHLVMTGEVTSKAYPKYRIITITKYDEYQSADKLDDMPDDKLMTSKRQANDKQMTSETAGKRQQYNNNNNINKETKEQGNNKRESTASRFQPPTIDEISQYCLEKGIVINIDRFFNHYESVGWMVGNHKMKNWKAAVQNWAMRDQEYSGKPYLPVPKKAAPVKTVTAQQYQQRDYSDLERQHEAEQEAEIMAFLRKERGES